jgi:hypothetical protein
MRSQLKPEDYENIKTKHHFYSCAELRMNAVDPEKDREHAEIFRFRIMSREPPILQLVKNDPVLIESQMCIKDLFSFDSSGRMRKNFERFFEIYEHKIEEAVRKLREKIDPIASRLAGGGTRDLSHDKSLDDILFDIWVLKFINFGRNPYGVRKFLNSLPPTIQNLAPTDPDYRRIYNLIDNLNKQECASKLNKLRISLEEYKEWLKALFILLLPIENSHTQRNARFRTPIEEIAFHLFHDDLQYRFVRIDVLSESSPVSFLVSDRAYFYSSQTADRMDLHFNVTSKIAMSFMSVNLDQGRQQSIEEARRLFPSLAPSQLHDMIEQLRVEIATTLQKHLFVDDKEWAKWFNQATIYQAHDHVFCNQRDVFGAKVLPAN